jgi:nucleoside-diphosphate-sugar epimerase
MARWLITGGSGFIGTNLIHRLSPSHALVNLDIVPPRDPRQIPYYSYCDVTDEISLRSHIRSFKPDHIAHLAALTTFDALSQDAYDVNFLGVRYLLRSIDFSLVKSVLVFSSKLAEPKSIPANRFRKSLAARWYSNSKSLAEFECSTYLTSYPVVIIRPTSIWGPWFSQPYDRFFAIASKRYAIFINPSSAATKTFGFVLNSVEQILSISINISETSGGTYYIGDYLSANISDFFQSIRHLQGLPPPLLLSYMFLRPFAFIGDILSPLSTDVPLDTFRLKNMTTDDIVDLSSTRVLLPELPFDRQSAISQTLEWLSVSRQSI